MLSSSVLVCLVRDRTRLYRTELDNIDPTLLAESKIPSIEPGSIMQLS